MFITRSWKPWIEGELHSNNGNIVEMYWDWEINKKYWCNMPNNIVKIVWIYDIDLCERTCWNICTKVVSLLQYKL